MGIMGKVKGLSGMIQSILNPIKYARKIGVKVGNDCVLGRPDFGSEPYLIEIGSHVLIAKDVRFITHEGGHWVLVGMGTVPPDRTFGYGRIVVKDNVYIGSGTTILRGVTIGENVIVGARSLVNKSLAANGVYAGVPAKFICSLEDFEKKFMADMPEYDWENYCKNKKDEVLKIVDKFAKR